MKLAKIAITLFSVVTILLAGCESKDDGIVAMEVSGVEAMIRDAGMVLNEFWMREIGKAIDIQGHTNTTVNLPDGK